MAFLSVSEFKAQVEVEKAERKVTTWTELPEEVVFNITSIREKISEKYGVCFLLEIRDNTDNEFKIWGPGRMIKLIEDNKGKRKSPFFISLGQRRYDKTKIVNDFDIIFQDGDVLIDDLFHRL